jgi:putative Mn2+ efflux pump MntP
MATHKPFLLPIHPSSFILHPSGGGVVGLFLLGFLLGIDSFRASLGLGIVHRSGARRLRIALGFGLCDGVAPLLGLAVGSAVLTSLSSWTKWVGLLVLGGFGLFTFLTAGAEEAKETETETASGWVCFGLPLTLSLDNLVAGLGLGALGLPVLPSAVLIGLISGLMSLAGLCLGSLVGRSLRARAGQVGGAALAVLAIGLAFDVL